jgi:hypothetical protein
VAIDQANRLIPVMKLQRSNLCDFTTGDIQPLEKRLMALRISLLKHPMPVAHCRIIQTYFAEHFDPLSFIHST